MELEHKINNDMKKENEQLKIYVVDVTNRSKNHREVLQAKYDEKMEKIKDVCTAYFSKYEKHLVNQQELIKTMETRQ